MLKMVTRNVHSSQQNLDTCMFPIILANLTHFKEVSFTAFQNAQKFSWIVSN